MVVADNVSTDRTAEVARAKGARVVSVEKRVIGAVRNGGAREARGEVLVFVDADAQMHRETFNEVDRSARDGPCRRRGDGSPLWSGCPSASRSRTPLSCRWCG